MLRCSFCARDLVYVHGHAACIHAECPLRMLNQAECCTGETGCFLAVPRSPLADGSLGPAIDDVAAAELR